MATAQITTTHPWKVVGDRMGVWNSSSSDISPNLLLVLDTTASQPYVGGLMGVKVPATSATLTKVAFGGICEAKIPNRNSGSVVIGNGSIVVCIASGTVTAGDQLLIDSASGKEGYAKTSTNDGSTAQLIIGHALTDATDGQYFPVKLQVQAA